MSRDNVIAIRVMNNPREGRAELKCYQCAHKRGIPGNAHIACANPDPSMTGTAHGIQNGWFLYPINFDPTWASSECRHFQAKKK